MGIKYYLNENNSVYRLGKQILIVNVLNMGAYKWNMNSKKSKGITWNSSRKWEKNKQKTIVH